MLDTQVTSMLCYGFQTEFRLGQASAVPSPHHLHTFRHRLDSTPLGPKRHARLSCEVPPLPWIARLRAPGRGRNMLRIREDEHKVVLAWRKRQHDRRLTGLLVAI